MCMRMGLFIFLCSLVKRKTNTQFLLAFVKTLTNSENCSQSRIRIFVQAMLFPLSHWSISQLYFLHVTVGFLNNSEVNAASGAVLRSSLYGETSTLRRFTVRIFRISK
jgi:hypothetical protein